MSPQEQEIATIESLRHAIDDSQGTIRAYDVKAEILAVLLTLIVGATSQTFCSDFNEQGQFLLKCAWVLCLLTAFLLGIVLMPKTNLFAKINYGTFTPRGSYHFHNISPYPTNSVSSIAANALATNWIEELTYEVMKLSLIRERKHFWFINSLWPAATTILVIILAIILG